MIDWNKRNGGFLAPESVYEDQLGNLSMQINQKDKEIARLNNIINELDKLIEQYSKNEYYYKYNGKYLKSEIINDLKELKEGKK